MRGVECLLRINERALREITKSQCKLLLIGGVAEFKRSVFKPFFDWFIKVQIISRHQRLKMKMTIKLCVLLLLSLEGFLSATEALCMVPPPRPKPRFKPNLGLVRKFIELAKYCQFIPSSSGKY